MSSVTPPSSYVPPAQTAPAPVEGEAVPAEIVKLPPTLANTDRALTLRGEVQAQNQDGSVRIATPRGPVDVKLPEPVPQRGQTVEVQLPAGSPPRSATVTVPPQPAPQQPVPPQAQTPNQPPVQNLPHAPVPPQAPSATVPQQPPVTGTPQQPQTQPPQQAATMPRDEVSVRPQAPSQPGVQPQQAQASQVSPQSLLNFLKTSMQTLMKTPGTDVPANPQHPAPQHPAQGAPQQQRPLQLGQMLRLTVLPLGQNPVPAQIPAPQTPLLNPAPATVQMPQAQTPTTLILLPQSAGVPAMPLQQNIQQLMQGQTAQLTTPQMPGAPAQANPLTRILMPLMPQAAMLTPAMQTAPAINTQLPLMNAAPQITTPPAPDGQIHQPIITARPGMQIPALTQPMDVRVTAMLPTAPAVALQNPAIANLLNGSPTAPVMFAQVTGQTPQGLPVVELPTFTTAPDGSVKPATTMMVLQFPARALPAATILQLNILPTPQGAVMAAPSTFSSLPALGDAMAWDALDDAIRSSPQGTSANNPLAAALPRPGAAAFTAPVMMMAAALRSGDLSAWIGEKGIDAIKTSRRADALSRISNDFATQSRRMDEPAQSGEWKSLALPMVYGQEVGRIHLYYRSFTQGEGEADGQNKKNGTRFVMDLSLTRMGPLQIDGFSIGKKLDVTLRSEQSLSPGMREMMRARYRDAIGGIGFAGELNFNASADHKGWVVMDDASVGNSGARA